jgi:DNA polymerase-3 subunit gamma/tau
MDTMAKRKTASKDDGALTPPEEYTVLARRYRPQQFDELVGQEAVAQVLQNALQSGRVAHAYLFTGARGVGKTSTARILAKCLNCVKGPTTKPCNECELCLAIASGDDIDVLEIDGASNRGIDEVREIRQNVQFRPSRARYKIYIIDEVHMLTPPAFNALLKTLEEPPPHVKFIFATTEVQKIPVTILSRCQRFDFAGIGVTRIVERLKQIIISEQMKADDEALELIARRAAGSMRDAQSLLDQLLAFGGDRLTVDNVHQLLGTANEDRVMALAGAVLAKDASRALDLLGQAADRGVQLGELLDQLLEYWRDLLIANCAGTDNPPLSVTGSHRAELQKQAQALQTDTILAGMDILVSAKNRMRATQHHRVLVEMALVRLARLDDLVSLAELAQQAGGQLAATPTARSGGTPNSRPVAPPEAEKKKPEPSPESQALTNPIILTPENTGEIWQQVLAQVGPMLAGDLRVVNSLAISGPNTLVLRLPPGYNRLEEHHLDPSRVGRIEAALQKVTGQTWNLRLESPAGSPPAAQLSGSSETATDSALSRSKRARAEALKQPLLVRAMDLLGAQIVHLDDGFGTAPPAVQGPHTAPSQRDGSDMEPATALDAEEN